MRNVGLQARVRLLFVAILLGGWSVGTTYGEQAPERDHFQLRFGATYDQGDFDSEELSRAVFVPVTLRYLGDRFDVGVTPSFALVNTAGGIRLVDGTPTPTGEERGARDTLSGRGDTILRARYYLVNDIGPESPVPSVTPFLKIKLPTAQEYLLLGTGKTDYGVGIEWDKQFRPMFLFGDVHYTFIGKLEGLGLRNRPGASFGMGRRISDAVTASGLLDWRHSIVMGNNDLAELVGVVTFRMSPTVSVSPHAFVGLTQGTSDFGGGFEMVFRFGRY